MNGTLSIEINMDGAAFDDYPRFELARIMLKIRQDIDSGVIEGTANDINGNKCCEWRIDEK